MNYFWIIGLILAPFLLNIVRSVDQKVKFWTHPLFFLLFVFAIFQVGLSWFTVMAIPSYLAYSIISYLIFVSIFLYVLIYSIRTIYKNKNLITWKFFLKTNISSLLAASILLLALLILLLFPEINNLSDTSAYMSISNFFKNNNYSLTNDNKVLDYFYRFPSGYYLNSVFSTREGLYLAYYVVWPLVIFYLFYWTIDFFINSICFRWSNIYKLIFVGFVNSVYLVLSFTIIYSFTGGNYEIQAILVFIAFVLALNKKFNYFTLVFLGFSLFSITALLISLPIFVALLVYLIFKSNWFNIFIWAISFCYIVFNLLAFNFDNPASIYSTKLVYTFELVAITSFLICLSAIFYLYEFKKIAFLQKNVLVSSKDIWLIKNIKNQNKNLILIIFYLITFIATFLCTQFIVLNNNAASGNLIILYVGSTSLFIFYITYALFLFFKKQRSFSTINWLIIFQFFYVAYVLFNFILFDLFNLNSSSWRIMLTSFTIGFISTYVGMIGILIATIINDNLDFFQSKLWIYKKHRSKKLYSLNLGLCSIFIFSSVAATSIVWSIRINDGFNKDNLNNQFSKNWVGDVIANEDKNFLKFINKLNSNQISSYSNLSNSDKIKNNPNNIRYSYYSDLSINIYLNNLYALSYGEQSRTSQYNNFVLSDTWLKIIQNKPINDLFYENVNNTIANVDQVINLSIDNLNSNNLPLYPTINKKANIQQDDASSPIKVDQFIVNGSPDFLIFNKKTEYYDQLNIIKNLKSYSGNKNDFIFTNNNIDNQNGYQYLYESQDIIYFYNNKTIKWNNINNLFNGVVNND
ncbi:hypothetical protein [Mycoplasmoides pirum]|uniref:hypothetical protein n=1 Tax=Mycoplasmoides pirum TaxID=2122 RepID=UPI0005643F96|nr:hypothetical protein [Mycoplasmoides pirum]